MKSLCCYNECHEHEGIWYILIVHNPNRWPKRSFHCELSSLQQNGSNPLEGTQVKKQAGNNIPRLQYRESMRKQSYLMSIWHPLAMVRTTEGTVTLVMMNRCMQICARDIPWKLGRFIKWVKQIHRVSSDGSHRMHSKPYLLSPPFLREKRGGGYTFG